MKIVKSLYCLLLILFLSHRAFTQDMPKWDFKGYIKNMSTFNFINNPFIKDDMLYENLTHNRLNFAWYPKDNISAYFEIRNRIVVGDMVRIIPNYGNFIDNNNDFFNLSANIIENDKIIFNVMLDRAYVQWTKENWEVKIGRQRINWGTNLAWNPNDWFNAYSFFDFDYEERPGSDAIRVSYYTGVASSVEIAAKLADNVNDFVAAGIVKVNKWNYDFQLLGGVANGDISLGAGWAGNIKLAGFKGELTYFTPFEETITNVGYDQMFIGSFSVDYSFKNSFYLNGAVLYNSNGSNDANIALTAIGQSLSRFTVRELSPYIWSAFIQSNYQFSPLFYGGVSVMNYPGTNSIFVNPVISYSILQSLDLSVIGQVFYGDNSNGNYDALSKTLFTRLKWSF